MLKEYCARFETFARAVNLCNKSGEYPTVISVEADPEDKTVQIITVQGDGLSLPLPVALDKEIRQLERHLGGFVADLGFGETTNEARFVLIPKEGKYENL